ncbi:MAG: GTP cyclohydrolase I FolE [Crocinitomicaceae bacterium]|nr:GTP cyclohydrolase I FolE [Crocinitomicaceae bacterium]
MKNELHKTIGDNHIGTSIETPILQDAFDKSDTEKIENIQYYFSQIMEELGLDLSDESLSGTPYRFAKMYVKELFYGLNPNNKPHLSTFPNKYGYKKMLIEKEVSIDSSCEHHFLPIVGHAHIGYIPEDMVIGLSKINRLVDYYSHRPQVQERLCLQILNDLQETLGTKNVIVVIDAKHLCVSSRGIKDKNSSTITVEYGGCFEDITTRNEFFQTLNKN